MRKVFQKIIRFIRTLLPLFYKAPSLPFTIDNKNNKKDSEWEKFKEDLIDLLILVAIFLVPFVAIFLLVFALAICLSK
jgi:flagellar biosynthesis/type III secretory pathway M-ring protein FliF/YscJ